MVIVWYLFYSHRLTVNIFSRLLDTDHLSLLFLSGVAFIIVQILAAYRLILLLRMIDLHLSFLYIFKLTMIGCFFNIVIPGMVGGDIIKGAYLFREEGEYRGRSSGIVLMDRVIGLVALLFIGLVSISFLLKQSILFPYADELNGIILISFGVLVLFTLFCFFGKKPWFRVKAKAISSNFFKKTILYHMTDAIGALMKRQRVLVYAFFLSLCAHVTALAGLLVLLRLTPDHFPDIILLAAVSSVVWLFGIIPITPGNIGWTELIASIGWSGVGSSSGAIIFFYWRVVTMLFSLPGGILYLLPQGSNDKLRRA